MVAAAKLTKPRHQPVAVEFARSIALPLIKIKLLRNVSF